ncbi:maleylpyruvate isomerase family mycothiol-dependent enzyme [Streptomyces sp. NPDC048604]|uniref:maleylpyruvate isomerase family mycothiol-dependent enzyme n=1 Tax=Streptomyces sp. NPDC048604 TaxID=3365578 RepID=UPI00371B848C
MSEALQSALAEALAELVTMIDTCDDDEMLDQDIAVKWLESTGYVLGRLSEADRRSLDRLFREAALRQEPGPWRESLLNVSEGFGLTVDLHDGQCDAVADLGRRFVAAVRDADPATPVPTCPGWTLADLTRHVGAVHRWAGHIVGTRSATRVLAADLPLDLPEAPTAYPDWLADSAGACLNVLRNADPDTGVWSPGGDPHVRYYSRHLLTELLVHLADAELALGGGVGPVEPSDAADGIDHFLTNAAYLPWVAEPVAGLGRDGEVLRLESADTGAVWSVTLGGGGFVWRRTVDDDATATVRGGVADLLLYVHGRYEAGNPRLAVTGDRGLLDAWRDATAL